MFYVVSSNLAESMLKAEIYGTDYHINRIKLLKIF